MATNTVKKEEILGVDDKSIKEYAELFSEHGLKSLEIKYGNVEICLKKDVPEYSAAVKEVYVGEPVRHPAHPLPAQTVSGAATQDPKEKSPEKEYQKIVSPIVGTFYSSPSPESEPFVKEGDTVTPSTVVCIVEAMKMMNEIKAGINGKIVKKVVDNNSAIEAGATLFLVKP